MADLATQLQERDYRETEGALALADRNRTWAQTFVNTPSNDVLRLSRDYESLLSMAVERKMQLSAQTDKKAQELYFAARMQPLKEELAVGKIRQQEAATLASGAAQRYKQRQDMQAMEDQVNFLHHMETAPPPGTPEHEKHILLGADKFPNILTTEYGKELLINTARGNDAIAQLRAQIPEGFEVESVTVGGGKQDRVTAKRAGEVPDAAKKELGALNALKASKAHWLAKEKDPVRKEGLQAEIDDADIQIKAWKETYGVPKDEAVAAIPAAVDKKSLAEKALVDPNASEAHKAAARKFLGQ